MDKVLGTYMVKLTLRADERAEDDDQSAPVLEDIKEILQDAFEGTGVVATVSHAERTDI